jgi:hypothetical protein
MTPAWRDRLIADLNAADERAVALAKYLSNEQLNWRPSPSEWSVGQCLDHLCEATEAYLPPMARALDGQPQGHAAEITPGFVARWFIRSYIEPSAVTKRGKAPKTIVPAADVSTAVVDRFLSLNRDLRAFVDRATGYDVNRVRFKNPFVNGIRWTVGTGLEILTRHQRRHLLQGERVKARMS